MGEGRLAGARSTRASEGGFFFFFLYALGGRGARGARVTGGRPRPGQRRPRPRTCCNPAGGQPPAGRAAHDTSRPHACSQPLTLPTLINPLPAYKAAHSLVIASPLQPPISPTPPSTDQISATLMSSRYSSNRSVPVAVPASQPNPRIDPRDRSRGHQCGPQTGPGSAAGPGLLARPQQPPRRESRPRRPRRPAWCTRRSSGCGGPGRSPGRRWRRAASSPAGQTSPAVGRPARPAHTRSVRARQARCLAGRGTGSRSVRCRAPSESIALYPISPSRPQPHARLPPARPRPRRCACLRHGRSLCRSVPLPLPWRGVAAAAAAHPRIRRRVPKHAVPGRRPLS